ncbi:GumC family protein [Methylobacterium sp. Leaf106]|uniref:GumC family protein n=1 Tax=Methylobacterium sp. Leaf106 TaxID=1736255 RepID=UPI0006FCD080|nr:GumC family protein [Methylobacterium sp. Leaf106]KQP37692.1 lipopolysaccharide biosynthesis protein [Methylobacterium sp. Leaf106]
MPRSQQTVSSIEPIPQRDEGLGLSQLFGVLARSWRWIVLPTLAAGIGAIVFVQVVPPRYTGEAKILLESRDASFARTAQERGEQPLAIDEQAVASQVQVVMSRDIAREAIRRLKLVGNAEFDPEVDGIGPVQRVLMMLGLGRNPMERAPEDRVLETYFDRLLVYPAGKSRILTVEFRSRDPDLAAKAANTIAELYIASLESAKVDTARYASTWLGGNIDTLRTRVSEAEAKVEAFRARNGLISGGGGTTSQPLGTQQLSELSTQLSQARTVKADLTSRAKLIREMIKDGRAFEIPDVANNEVIRRTVEQRITLRGQLALESRTLMPAHPRIKELTAQIGDLDAQIKSTADRVVRTMENDARIAEARVESLNAAVDAQREVVSKGNSSEVQLRALEREAKAQRDQLESYLSRYREASARDAESAAPADARVVSRAVVPQIPSFPKKLPIVALALVMAMLLSSGGVAARHLLRDPDETRRRTGPDDRAPEPAPFAFPEASTALSRTGTAAALYEAPLIARVVVPLVAAAPASVPEATPLPVREDTEEAAGEAGRTAVPSYDLQALTRRLRERMGRNGGSLLVAETDTDADRQLAGILAEALAASGRVLLVDVNGPASPSDDAGLTDLVAGEAAFLDVIRSVPSVRRLHAIPRGFVDCDILTDEPEALAIALDALAQSYDWVVYRLGEAQSEGARDLLTAMAGRMNAIVIASNTSPEDPELVALYGLADREGSGSVLVAGEHTANEHAAAGKPGAGARLSAA